VTVMLRQKEDVYRGLQEFLKTRDERVPAA